MQMFHSGSNKRSTTTIFEPSTSENRPLLLKFWFPWYQSESITIDRSDFSIISPFQSRILHYFNPSDRPTFPQLFAIARSSQKNAFPNLPHNIQDEQLSLILLLSARYSPKKVNSTYTSSVLENVSLNTVFSSLLCVTESH